MSAISYVVLVLGCFFVGLGVAQAIFEIITTIKRQSGRSRRRRIRINRMMLRISTFSLLIMAIGLVIAICGVVISFFV